MVNMLLFGNCCWIKVRSLDRPFGFPASPAHFLFLSLYQERYLERNKRKQVLSLHNLHNRCRYQIVFRSQQKINIFPPRGTWACAPVPPESMDQILGAPPTFTAFLKGRPAGCRPAQQEIRPRSVTASPPADLMMIWSGTGTLREKKAEVWLWVSSSPFSS